MEMQSFKLHVGQETTLLYCWEHITHRYAKFIFGKASCDIGMCMCANVGIDAKGNMCNFALGSRQLIDDIKLGKTFYIETEDVVLKREVYFPVSLSNSSIDNFRRGKASSYCCLYFPTADTISTKSLLTYDTEYGGVSISFDSVVHKPPFMSSHF